MQAAFTVNTDTLAIELDAPTNVTVKIRRIRVMHSDGTATVSADYYRKVKIITESAGGTGGSTFTPIARDANATPAISTVKTGLTALGTVDKTVDIYATHSTNDFIWQAVDEDDKIVVKPGIFFGIVINPAN